MHMSGRIKIDFMGSPNLTKANLGSLGSMSRKIIHKLKENENKTSKKKYKKNRKKKKMKNQKSKTRNLVQRLCPEK